MRCDDVMRALSRPGARREEGGAVAEHLARCDRCAALAARGRRLERLWDATGPGEPTAEAWERCWSGVLQGLDQPARRPEPVRSVPRWRPWSVVGLVGLAQAAALLVAIGISWSGSGGGPDRDPGLALPPGLAAADEPSLDSEFEIEEGQIALIRSEGGRVEMIDLTDLDSAHGEDPWFVFFNRVEAASAVVAMAE